MLAKPNHCSNCVLEKISQGFSTTVGKGTSKVAIVGDHISYSELNDGVPFKQYSEGGSKLEETFRTLGVSKDQFLLTNLLRCIPPRESLEYAWFAPQAISNCHEKYNDPLFDMYGQGIKVIVALGASAMKFFTGFSGIAKDKQALEDVRGFVLPWQDKLVISSYTPKFLRSGNTHLTPVLEMDIRRALEVANGLYTNYPTYDGYIKPDYNEYPSLDVCWSFHNYLRDNPNLFLSYDIETAIKEDIPEDQRTKKLFLMSGYVKIILIQFSFAMGMGIAIPFTREYFSVIQAILLLSNPKGNHNTWSFDNPLLQKEGIKIAGNTHDTMWMFKHYHPNLPRGLQAVASYFGFPFPWKHLFGSKLQWYGCADVDAVQWIMHKLPGMMRAVKVWNGYIGHVYNVKPILDYASKVGMPVNEEKRLQLNVELKGELAGLQKLIHSELPIQLRNIKPSRKSKKDGEISFGYVREPKIVTELVDKWNKVAPYLDKLETQGKKIKFKDGFHYIRVKTRGLLTPKGKTKFPGGLVLRKFNRVQVNNEGEKVASVEQRWCYVDPFKASNKQLLSYIRWKTSTLRYARDKHLYRIPLDRKKKTATTNAKALREIVDRTGDVVLTAVIEYRSIGKIITNDLVNWKPDQNNRVHTEWGFKAGSGQFDSRLPNVQNASKHTPVGKRFRGIIIAPSGYVIVEFDYKAFHVALMGFLAKSKNYIRFSQLDPHSIFLSWIGLDGVQEISMDWSDSDIMLACKELKRMYGEIRQGTCKPAVLGHQLGLGPYKLWNQNKKYIKDVDYAEFLQKRIVDKFPETDLFKRKLLEEVHVKKYYRNNFGRIQYFYEAFAFKWDGLRQCWVKEHGKDTEAIYASAVQGNAFGMITELGIILPAKQDMHKKYNFVNTIHDSIVCVPRVQDLDKCIEGYHGCMTAACKQLVNTAVPEGLKVNVEVSMGECFARMEEMDIREGRRVIDPGKLVRI